MGFILNKSGSDADMKKTLKEHELKALHECLTWSRIGNNNKTLQMYATNFENFHTASMKLMDKIRMVLPQGSYVHCNGSLGGVFRHLIS